jgi:LuxR family maltose regulon positive regulatory protein
VPLLHLRASLWYESNDLSEEAIGHALAARDFDRATYLMELAVPMVRRNRREAMLLGWLNALPDQAVRRSPVLSVLFGYMLMASGDLAAVEARLDDADRALAAGPQPSAPPWADTEELRTLPATIAIHRASLAQARGDVAGTAEHARRALDLAGPGDHLARGGAAGFLGLAAWAQGDVSSALETFTDAVASLHAAGNLVDELSSTVVLADMWIAAGRPGTARRLYRRALQVSEAHGEPVLRATGDLHVGLGELDFEFGDLGAAKRHLERAAALGEAAAMTEGRYRWFVASARIAAAEADPQAALALFDRAQQLHRPGFFPDVRPIAALKARVWISQGDLSQAADWARDAGVSVSDEPRYLREFEHLTLVRLLIAQSRADPDNEALGEAVSLLGGLHQTAEISGRLGSLFEIRMLQALALHAQGLRTQAASSLHLAWAHAPEPDAYVRLFLDEGAPMLALLRDAADHGPSGLHARRLLRFNATHGGAAAGEPLRTDPVSGELLTQRELQVLRLLDSDLSGPQIARELYVSHNTLRTHTKHIFTKLEVTTRRAAVARARERGLI